MFNEGLKLRIISRTCNTTVARARKMLVSTCGLPATCDKKTLMMLDELVSNVNSGMIPDDFEFVLREHSNVVTLWKLPTKGFGLW